MLRKVDRLEDMIDAVVLRIARQGEVLDASAKARTILNCAPELLFGTGLFDRVHLSDRVAYLSALADMREGAVLRRLDLRIRLPQNGNGRFADNYRRFSFELVRAEATGRLHAGPAREAKSLPVCARNSPRPMRRPRPPRWPRDGSWRR